MLNFIPYRKGYKWGFVDKNKQTVVECKYEQTYPLNDYYGLARQGNHWGIINTIGNFQTPVNFYTFEIIFDDVIAYCTEKKGKIGFYLMNFQKLTPPEYDAYELLDGKVLAVKKDEKYAFMNPQGEFLTDFIYSGIGYPTLMFKRRYFDNDLIIAKNKKGYVYVDVKGTELEYQTEEKKFYFDFKIADIGINIYDKNGNKTGGQFGAFRELDTEFDEGLAPLKKKLFWNSKFKYGYVDKTGKTIIPFEYEGIGYFSEGLSAVKKNGLWGFIDKNNKTKIEFTYIDLYGGFENGLVPVSKHIGNKQFWFFIDKKGTLSSEMYEGDFFVRGNRSIVKRNGLYGIIDFDGNELIPCVYNQIAEKDIFFYAIRDEIHYLFDYDCVQVKEFSFNPKFFDRYIYKKLSDFKYFNEGYGLCSVDSDHKEFVSITEGIEIEKSYKSVYHFHNGLAFVRDQSGDYYEWGFIDSEGTEYWEDKVIFRRTFSSDPHFSYDENGNEVVEGWGSSIDLNKVQER